MKAWSIRPWSKFVPRLAILGEWEGFGEVCWKWLAFVAVEFAFIYGVLCLVAANGDFLRTDVVIACDGWVRL
jgi:hypothetical protein